MKSEAPFDPYRRSAELIAESLEDCPFVALVGFEEEPDQFDAEIERLGGVVLIEVGTAGGTAFFREGSRWRRFLLRLEIAWHRLRSRGRDPGVTRIPDGPAD
jgi:hypothetical protein